MAQKRMDSRLLLQNLMDNMPDAIYFKDRESRFIKVNPACLAKLGWTSGERIEGKTDFDIFAKEHAEQAFAAEQKIIETGETLLGIEEKEIWPDGRISWASSTKMPMKNGTGEIIGTFGISRDITRRKNDELRVQQAAEKIRIIKEEMEDDFRMAADLQKTFFPSSYPAFPEGAPPEECCIEFLHDFKACSKIGGDYCSIHRCSKTEVGIFLCDVQGVGVRSALGTALVRGIMQEIAPQGLEPGAYLTRMNELLISRVCQEEILLDITACYLVLDTISGAIRFASAGHPHPLLFREAGAAQWLCEGQKFYGPPLASQPDATYSSTESLIGHGDAIVLFTDGLYTAENTHHEPYGTTRLIDAAQGLVDKPLANIFRGLEEGALAFAEEGRFIDDVCLVGLRLRPS